MIDKTPRRARSISNLLKRRKINKFGKTQIVMASVMILVSAIFSRYCGILFPCAVKRYMINPTINGRIKPEIIPVSIVSYFSALVIFGTTL